MTLVVVFDFDGTLVDSNAVKREAFYSAVSEFPRGRELLDRALARGGDRHEVFQHFSRNALPGADAGDQAELAKSLVSSFTADCRRRIRSAPERRGATKALRKLSSSGASLYINSATPQNELPALLHGRGWLCFFRGIYGSPMSKDQALRKICLRERQGPRAVIMVGDSSDDLLAATEVGTRFVGIVAEGRLTVRIPTRLMDLQALPDVVAQLGPCRQRVSERPSYMPKWRSFS